MEPASDKIVQGDALAVAADWRSGFVDCIVTSPPYWRQRDYRGAAGHVGQEPTAAAYIDRLTAIYRECRRVLQDTGTPWIVIGDNYEDGEQLGLPWRLGLSLIDDG